ncbi:MAG: nucleotidyl transferase AbiEii/AbiGii toxin family protein [Ignavibacteriae bacterium]|nr:nucleotidyl transferase AbiEii/AbiGii toxin family protein [Ignavibacteriota bacterium]
MINKRSFQKEWIVQEKAGFPLADPIILEKTVYAFELLGNLIQEGVPLIFKGGTSLLLLLEKTHRLSIDLDIVTTEEAIAIEQTLDAIVKKGIFKRWEEDTRAEKGVPVKHYKLYFDSVVSEKFPGYVLLDVVFVNNPYPAVQQKIIQTPFFETDEIVPVVVPTINSILGDKLTAFAPTTTGLKFGTKREMEINKQLFDIGKLFDIADNLNEIETSFLRTVEIENQFRKSSYTANNVVDDLTEICLHITQLKIKGGKEDERTPEIINGMQKLRTHLVAGTYNLEDLKLNAAKCACVISLFGNNADLSEIRRNTGSTSEKILQNEKAILERLKNILPEVYYYWQIHDNYYKQEKKLL